MDPVAVQQQLQDFLLRRRLHPGRFAARRRKDARVNVEEDGEFTRARSPRILAYGAMQVKFMAISGSSDPWEAEQLAGKTLGVMYQLERDEILFTVKPGYYAAKSKSSDQTRELVILGRGNKSKPSPVGTECSPEGRRSPWSWGSTTRWAWSARP